MATSNIRLAHPADEQAVFSLVRIWHEESGLMPFSAAKTLAYLRPMIAQQGGVVLVVAGPKMVEAAMGLVLGSFWTSESYHLEQLFDVVHPDCRKSEHAKNLLQHAKVYSQGLGTPLLAEVVSNETTQRKAQLVERQLPKVGSLFYYRGPAAQPVAAA
jgi:N-acetylglutamate synthase-like GNAT family acetyltransferase